ncbi:TetR/AcrR family transcriptional regulator [Luteimicrobium sp. DT211]|uniref:TetR/AcrR family transcriptional regulator n=1 Tax=Luteimicrobium sp. DT211 TaxID=3393412 RepID=UPI003CE853AF
MRSDARANRDAVVVAARTLVSTQGADVSLSAIADDAGVGIATLYRHFPTRQDLLAAVVLDARDRVVAVVEEHRDRVAADPAAGWDAFAHALARLRLGALLPELVAVLAAVPDSSEIEQMRQDSLAAVESVLDVARRAGAVRDDVTAARFTIGLSAVTRTLPVDVPLVPPDQQEWMTDVYLRGLRP